jgi:predicted enzyme related to lactoylglutathione lyase
MPNPVTWWEITGKDGKKLQDFYAQLFDWHVDANNPMDYGMVDAHADGGIGGGISADQNGMNRVTIYVQVDDLDAYLKKAESLGGKTVVPVTEVPGMVTFAMFQDVGGNIVGLVKQA